MKYTGIGLLLVLLAAPGCLPVPVVPEQPAADVTAANKAAAPKPPPVKVDEVTEANAHEMADALQAELEWALKETPTEGKPLKVRP
jgi:hypothetical protein